MTTITNNPFECGKKLKTGFDYFAKGFCKNGLVDAHYRLIADRRQAQLLLECASFEEIDEHYNPGEYDDESDRLTTDMVLEAVRVRQFGQTAKTMAALQRVLNKHLAATGKLVNDEPMFAGDAIIGKPKKSGLFASVTVQFPINDGQTLSIIFHSPDNNKMKITAADEIIAFRWLLNKRDITSAVAPDSAEEGTLPGMAAAKDVSLEEVGIRCAQLIAKNSDRFAAKSAEIQQAKKELEDIKGQVTGLQDTNGQLQQDLAAKVYEDEQTAAKIAATQKQLDAQVNYNDELRAKLDALKATGAGNAGKDHGEDTTGGVSKAEQEAAEFEAKKAAFEDELKGRGFEAGADSVFTFSLGEETLKAQITAYTNIGYGVIVGTETEAPKATTVKTVSGLDAQITKALAWIDKKLAGMKKSEDDQAKAIAAREAEQNARNAEVQEELRITGIGKTAVPGVRPADAREAGIMYELFQKGEITQDQWNAYVEDLYVSNKAPRPEPKTTNPDAAGDTTDKVSASLATLDDILNGKYQTSNEIMPLLEQVAEVFERLALAEDSPEMKKLDQAADYMTAILDKEAA